MPAVALLVARLPLSDDLPLCTLTSCPRLVVLSRFTLGFSTTRSHMYFIQVGGTGSSSRVDDLDVITSRSARPHIGLVLPAAFRGQACEADAATALMQRVSATSNKSNSVMKSQQTEAYSSRGALGD